MYSILLNIFITNLILDKMAVDESPASPNGAISTDRKIPLSETEKIEKIQKIEKIEPFDKDKDIDRKLDDLKAAGDTFNREIKESFSILEQVTAPTETLKSHSNSDNELEGTVVASLKVFFLFYYPFFLFYYTFFVIYSSY